MQLYCWITDMKNLTVVVMHINTFVMHAAMKHVFILNNKSWPVTSE